MKDKILVTYASKLGSTSEIAHEIGKVLRNHYTVDIFPVKSVRTLEPYHSVVVGSAVRVENWLSEAVEFVQDYQAELQALPTAFFTVCMIMHKDNMTTRAKVRDYMAPVLNLVTPDEIGYFAGKLDYNRLSLVTRQIAQERDDPEGDLRDWDKIRAWAQNLPQVLNLAQA